RLVHSEKGRRPGRAYSGTEHAGEGLLRGYDRSLGWALRHWIVTLAILLVTIGLNWYLFPIVLTGVCPQRDNAMRFAGIQASQSTSCQAMRQILADDAAIIGADPGIESV